MKTSHHSLSYLALTAACVRAGLVARQGVVGTTTRYWDCCKASCSWSNKAAFSAPVNTCDINDQPLANGRDAASGCNADGQAFMCSDQQPLAIDDTLAYGFAAMTGSSSEADTCCACYELSFTDQIQGKVMVVQATNIGYDVKSTQFDIALPGGGVGAFPQGCQKQYSAPERGWGTDPGRPYGGVASRSECDQLPAKLQAGCNFRFDWLQGANNPGISYERVSCPAELVAKTGCRRDDDGLYPPAPGSGATVPAPEVPVKVPEPESGSTVPAPDSDTTVPPPSNGGNDGGSNGGNNGDNNGGNGDNGDDCDGDSSDGSTTSALYGQCGGINWTGPSRCAEGAVCQKQNDYYSQCV